MDKKTLVEKDIESGKKLIVYLDKRKLDIKAAMWLYSSDLNRWYFIISSPLVDSEGSRKLYLKIAKIINKERGNINFNIDDIRLMPYHSPFIELMKMAIHTGPGINGIRFQNNVINGKLIEDAFIYRMQ